MRQTNLTTGDIAILLETQDTQHPRCFLINELGELAKAGDAEAENMLGSFLDPDHEEDLRAIACAHLASMETKSNRTRSALLVFASQPENTNIISWLANKGTTPPAA